MLSGSMPEETLGCSAAGLVDLPFIETFDGFRVFSNKAG